MCLHEPMSERPSAATVRTRVNAALSRLTRHQLVTDATVRVAADAARRQRAAAPKGGGTGSSADGTARSESFPRDYDEELVEIIRAVRPYTMTGHDKLHALITAVRYIVRHDVPGDIVECGVWRGGSMHAAARTLDALGRHDRNLYLYDTFEGMTTPTAKDIGTDGRSAAERLAEADPDKSLVWAKASLEDVRQGFEQVPYPTERVHYVKGPVEQTIPGRLPSRIAILRLDTDWYESTAHELEHMYDLLVPGGVLMIDDYGWWQGSRQATDEFLDRTAEKLLLLRTGSGRTAVKPWA